MNRVVPVDEYVRSKPRCLLDYLVPVVDRSGREPDNGVASIVIRFEFELRVFLENSALELLNRFFDGDLLLHPEVLAMTASTNMPARRTLLSPRALPTSDSA